jgi:hypothetical protein
MLITSQFWYGHLLRSTGIFLEVRPGDLKPPKELQASPLAMSPFSPARPREPHGLFQKISTRVEADKVSRDYNSETPLEAPTARWKSIMLAIFMR